MLAMLSWKAVTDRSNRTDFFAHGGSTALKRRLSSAVFCVDEREMPIRDRWESRARFTVVSDEAFANGMGMWGNQ
jgi:hypothetical protein